MKRNAYRDGRVHVLAEQCATCIFRPGNLMHLSPGRLRDMVDSATRADSAVICHDTLDGDNAVCRGFFDRYDTTPIQFARRLDVVEYVTTGGDDT